MGEGAERFAAGERVGVPWLGWTCGDCRYCRSGRENLCERARFTGYQLDGGYAEMAVADERYCFPLPDGYARPPGGAAAVRRADRLPVAAAVRRPGERLGLYGFGASAHIVCQVAVAPGARGLRLHPAGRRRDAGVRPASWGPCGPATPRGSEVSDPSRASELDAAIIFAPVGELVPVALRAVGPGRDGGLRAAST